MRLALEKKMKAIYEMKKMRASAEKGALSSPTKTPVKTPNKNADEKTPTKSSATKSPSKTMKQKTPNKDTITPPKKITKMGTWAFKDPSTGSIVESPVKVRASAQKVSNEENSDNN